MSNVSPYRRLLRTFAREHAPGLVVALAVFTGLVYVNGTARIFELDPDEGNNVIKALLVREGYAYGTEIWTDQPPLFSYLLLPAFALFGATMDVARGAVSAFSALLIWGVYEALRRSVGHLGSLLGVGLLLTSTLYVPLSFSVMIGLPSVACLTVGTLLLIEAGRRRDWRAWVLAGAGGCLAGAAAGIKLFTVPAMPALLLAALVETRGPSPFGEHGPLPGLAFWKRAGVRASLFGGGFVLLFILSLAPFLLTGTLSGLIETHQAAREQAGGNVDGLAAVRGFLRDDPILFVLALQGALIALVRRMWSALPWLGWLVASGLALVDHSPVWPHHRLLLSVPAAVLAGHALFVDFGPAVPQKVRMAYRFVAPVVAGLAVGLAGAQKGRLDAMLHPAPLAGWTKSDTDWKIFAEFSRYAEHSRFVAAARPTFAFRAGRPVPPNLAVTSWKRFRVGLLSARRVASDVDDTNPETVLFSSRWPGSVRAAVEKKIKKTHRRVKRWRHQSTDLWVDKELLSRMSEPEEPTGRADDSAL